MYAEFDESLVTGNEMIDSQHKELIAKINSLVESCEKDGGKVAAIKMLDYLAEYTEFHFNAEEKLQEEIEYPGIEEHKKQHQELYRVVDELHDMLEEQEGPTEEFVEQVNRNVIQWLYKHIKGFEDRKSTRLNSSHVSTSRMPSSA